MSRRGMVWVFLILSLLPCKLSATAQLAQAMMTKTKPANDCTTPVPATTFYTTDAQAYLWFSIEGLNAGDVAATAYYSPSGQYYPIPSGSFDPVTSAGTWCFIDTPFQIQGALPASQPGTWKVYIYNNSTTLGSVSFSVLPPCTYTISPTSGSVAAAGGTGSFSITAGSGCAWSASSNASWLTTSSSGTGSGTASYSAAANTASTSRSGTITAGGQSFTLTQAAASGAPGSLNLNINQVIGTNCPSNQVIVSVTDTQGNPVIGLTGANFTLLEGGQSRTITVVPVGSGSTSGTLSLAIMIDVSGSLSGSGLTNEKAAAKQLISQLGGTDLAAVWQFQDTVKLLQDFTSDKTKLNAAVDAAGGGGGTALYDAVQQASQAMAARTGRKAMVVMTDGEDYDSKTTIDNAIAAAKAAGVPVFAVGFGSANQTILTRLSTQTGGFYSAASTSADLQRILASIGQVISSQYQITYTSGAPTTDNQVDITVTSGGQTATASRTVSRCSSTSCAYSLGSSSASAVASGGTGTVTVTAGTGCAWTAASNTSWVSITAGASGSGAGTVTYSFTANTGGARTGTLTIAGQTFTVNQAAGSTSSCNYFVQPLTQTIPASGGTGIIVQVFTGQGCTWTATSNATWITILGGSTGNGNGAVSYNVPANPTAANRVGTVTIAGQTHTVTQLAGAQCNYIVTPGTWDLTAAGGILTILVTVDSGCSWTAASNDSWITLSSSGSHSGTGRVYFNAQANSTTSGRSGTVTVAGQVITVTQLAGGAPCGYSVAPTIWNVPAAATNGGLILTTAANCSWKASSSVAWISITSAASGTGTSTIAFAVQANTATTARTGILNVAGLGVTLIQAAAPPPQNPNTPTIADGGVVNAASNRPGTLARGSFFTVYGSNLGPPQPSQATSYPIPDTMGGIVVTVTQGGTTKRAFLHFVSATQINAIMPSDAPLGDVQITVIYNGVPGAASSATVVDSNFGAFSVAGGAGPGILQNYVSASVQPLNLPSLPAKPGQIIILWGTGLGPIAQPDNEPPAGGSLNIPVAVEVGGKPTKILYNGRAPTFAAVDNIYFELPADVPTGCSVPVRVKVQSTYSNTVRMAISSDGSACQDTANPFSGMTSTGSTSGAVVLMRTTIAGQLQFSQPAVDATFDVALAMFTETNAGGAFGYSALLNLPPVGSCTSNTKSVDFTALLGGSVYSADPTVKRELDAGTELKITGPNGSSTLHHMNTSSNTGPYLAVLGGSVPISGSPAMPPFLEPGNFTITGSGGKDVGAFTASLTVPPALTWTNRSAVSVVDRTVPLSLTWTGGDPGSTVVILGGVSDTKTKRSGAFGCLVPTSAGQFSVPPSVLADLPTAAALTGTDDAIGVIAVGIVPLTNLTKFSAPGLTTGYGIVGSMSAKMVQVK